MQKQLQLSSSSAKIKVKQYKSYGSSVGNNLKSIQITTKYRYQMLKQKKLKIFCKISIEEACKRWKIEIVILKVLPEHAHMIVDCPRTISDAKLMQIIKGLSSYILFRLCPDFRKRYPRGEFWNDGYFCASCGSDFEKAMKYIENQEIHHYGFH
jgi:REP element-mobilizing transposase RayT